VLRLAATPRHDGIGLAEVDNYSSEEGVALYADHEYDLIADYDNTSQTDQDAMATMLLYVSVRDLEFTATLTDGKRRSAWQRVSPERLPRRSVGDSIED
jgi:hypothetical protein